MKNIFVRGRTLVGAAVFAAATLTGGCDNLKENLLEAPNPNNIDPSNVQSAAGANAVRLGALARLRTATGAAESTWLFGGLLADAMDRRRLMMATQSAQFCVSGSLLALAMVGGLSPGVFYVASAMFGLFSTELINEGCTPSTASISPFFRAWSIASWFV